MQIRRRKRKIGKCGFRSAYISHTNLEDLLKTSNAVGVRIYNGKDNSNEQYCGIIAVAIDEDGKEVPKYGKKYLFGTSYDTDHSCPSDKVNKGYAEIVLNSSAHEHQKGYFSKTVIEGLKTGSSLSPGRYWRT